MTVTTILEQAKEAARQNNLNYEGLVTPAQAHTLMQAADFVLVDVRTQAEFDWVGRIPGAIEIEWQTYPGSERNPRFMEQLRAKVAQDKNVMFICRSGARSNAAAQAAEEAGYRHAYNVLQGFEGDKNTQGQRNQVSGWRFSGLPWIQS